MDGRKAAENMVRREQEREREKVSKERSNLQYVLQKHTAEST